MTKYREKPNIVEAVQWFPGTEIEGVQYPPLPGTPQGQAYLDTYGPCGLFIEGNGSFILRPGTWLITDVNGYHWPCGAADFAATYDKVGVEP